MRKTLTYAFALLVSSGVSFAVGQDSSAMAASDPQNRSSAPSESPEPDLKLAVREPAESEPVTGASSTPETPAPAVPRTIQQAPLAVTRGQASWYGPGFFGNRTASGEVLRPGTLTAAHRSLPFGTRVRVTNLYNGRSAVVRINDRGPFHGRRVIDLAHGAAGHLGLISSGVADVKLEVLPNGD
jgi:rare lipoprotein A